MAPCRGEPGKMPGKQYLSLQTIQQTTDGKWRFVQVLKECKWRSDHPAQELGFSAQTCACGSLHLFSVCKNHLLGLRNHPCAHCWTKAFSHLSGLLLCIHLHHLPCSMNMQGPSNYQVGTLEPLLHPAVATANVLRVSRMQSQILDDSWQAQRLHWERGAPSASLVCSHSSANAVNSHTGLGMQECLRVGRRKQLKLEMTSQSPQLPKSS